MRSILAVTEAAKQVRLETLARLRVKVARMTDEDGFPAVTIILDDILALIDEEMRDA